MRVWELPSGQMLWEGQAHEGRIRSMAFDDSGDLLLTGGGDGIARLWCIPSGEQIGDHPAGCEGPASGEVDLGDPTSPVASIQPHAHLGPWRDRPNVRVTWSMRGSVKSRLLVCARR